MERENVFSFEPYGYGAEVARLTFSAAAWRVTDGRISLSERELSRLRAGVYRVGSEDRRTVEPECLSDTG